MRQVTLQIPDRKYLTFMELIANLGFVKKVDTENQNVKKQILNDIREAVQEVNLIKKGKLKGISAKDLLSTL